MRSHRFASLLTGAISVAVLAASCGGDDDPGSDSIPPSTPGASTTSAPGGATTTGPSTTTAAEEHDPDAVARIGVNLLRSGSYNFDPRTYTGNVSSYWLYQLYAPLLQLDPATLEYTPYLAESFEVVDPRTLSVTIRSDATFHDGRPVTANDAKASIEANKQNQADGTSNVNRSIQNISSIDVTDDRTFVVHFSVPSVLTMYELMTGPEFLVSPADAGPEQATAPIGNGPFRFVSHAENQSFTLERFAEFFDADDVLLGGLEFVNLAEGNTQINALLAGDIEVATDTSADGMGALEGRDGFEGRAVLDSVRYLYLTFCAAPDHFWEDPLLLQAVKRATDREQIASALYDDYAAPSQQFYPVGHPYHDPALDEEFSLDLDVARSLVEQAGLPAGAGDGLWATSAIPESQDLALLLDAQWGEIGVGVTPVLSDDLTGDALQPSKADPPTLEGGDTIVIENTRTGLQRLTRQIDSASIVNTCNYSNPRLSEIEADLAALAPDDPAAAALWHEASRIALEEAPFMVLVQKPSFVAFASDRVGGVADDAFKGSSEGSFQFQDWWIAAG